MPKGSRGGQGGGDHLGNERGGGWISFKRIRNVTKVKFG